MAPQTEPHAALRTRLESTGGRHYWRTLEEFADSPEFQKYLENEFPERLKLGIDGIQRRHFLKLMAASMSLAGMTGCTEPPAEAIVPHVRTPETDVDARPLEFATAMTLEGLATGLVVRSYSGRPTKVAGNPLHPASLGATDAIAEASILSLYDPDRSQTIRSGPRIRDWDNFFDRLQRALAGVSGDDGGGLRILSGNVTSPTVTALIDRVKDKFPGMVWYSYEPVTEDNVRAGNKLAFGRDVSVVYESGRAATILTLDADLFGSMPGHLRYAREFSGLRQPCSESGDKLGMARLYCTEPTPTPTGSIADHRLPIRASRIEPLARAIASRLDIDVAAPSTDELPELSEGWLDAVVADLQSYRLPGRAESALVVAGPAQPPLVHALAHAMNERLGSIGEAVRYVEPVSGNTRPQLDGLSQLAEEARDGQVDVLLILESNPVYSAPAEFDLADLLRTIPFSVHLGSYYNATGRACRWHVPATHYLESWGDARAMDGTVSLMQPLIAPLYRGKSAAELLAAVLGERRPSGYRLLRQQWLKQFDADQAETRWHQSLHDGIVPDTAATEVDVTARTEFADVPLSESAETEGGREDGEIELTFRPDPALWDGRFSNNAWLQEMPKPLLQLTWGNAALISPATARRMGLETEDVIELSRREKRIRIPVMITPGHCDEAVTLHLGHGRQWGGSVGNHIGTNVYPLRTADAMYIARDATLRKTGERQALATTQHHHLMGGRHLVVSGTLDELRQSPESPPFMKPVQHHVDASLYPEYEYEGHQWGMSIDLNQCIGCKACVIACQAENNIPVVGKEEVRRGREMHWIRVDAYYEGTPQSPEIYSQPVPCMHCEKAPCEVVCPVAATVHSSDGLNDMVYNRCVGTRYCSNNCPYKVRRFNYFEYQNFDHEPLELLANPEVTVRTRGVMEKCTYCVQRIRTAEINAETDGRPLRDGDVVTACQAACPTQAIVFGDLNDASSRVAQKKDQPLDYALLGELNTEPRTTYSAALRNPNPRVKT